MFKEAVCRLFLKSLQTDEIKTLAASAIALLLSDYQFDLAIGYGGTC